PEAPLIGHQSSPDSRIPRRTLECFATGRIRAELRNMSTPQARADFTTPQASAEVLFKRKEELLLDGQKAWAEYEARGRAVRENTARLRALRLAREAAMQSAGKPLPMEASERAGASKRAEAAAQPRRQVRSSRGKAAGA